MTVNRIKPVEPLPPLADATSPAKKVPPVVWIALALFLFSIFAAWGIFMAVPGVRVGGNEFSNDRAVFVAVNCGTLTGFPYTVGVSDFNPDNFVGPMVSLILTLIGVLATLIMGSLAAVRALRLLYSDRQVIGSAVTATLLASLGGAIVMGIGMPAGFGLFDAIFQGVCAFGNCGLVTGHAADLAGWRLHLVLLPLATLGGIGLPVLMELYDWAIKRRPISRHSATTILAAATVYLIGLAGLLLFLWPTPMREAMGAASALSLDARTFGFPISIDTLSRAGQMWLVLLMAIGAGSAGTAGGLKLTNLIVVGGGFRQSLRGNAPGRISAIACAWLGCYFALAAACWMTLLQLEPQIPADRLAFLSVSAVSNVGLSTETVTIVSGGLYVLSAAMLLGRLAPIAMLWWMVRSSERAELLVA